MPSKLATNQLKTYQRKIQQTSCYIDGLDDVPTGCHHITLAMFLYVVWRRKTKENMSSAQCRQLCGRPPSDKLAQARRVHARYVSFSAGF